MRVAPPGFQFRKPIEEYICLCRYAVYVYNPQRNVNESLFFRIVDSEPFLSMYFQKALVLLVLHVADNSFKLELCFEALFNGRNYMVVDNAQTQTSQRSWRKF